MLKIQGGCVSFTPSGAAAPSAQSARRPLCPQSCPPDHRRCNAQPYLQLTVQVSENALGSPGLSDKGLSAMLLISRETVQRAVQKQCL